FPAAQLPAVAGFGGGLLSGTWLPGPPLSPLPGRALLRRARPGAGPDGHWVISSRTATISLPARSQTPSARAAVAASSALSAASLIPERFASMLTAAGTAAAL